MAAVELLRAHLNQVDALSDGQVKELQALYIAARADILDRLLAFKGPKDALTATMLQAMVAQIDAALTVLARKAAGTMKSGAANAAGLAKQHLGAEYAHLEKQFSGTTPVLDLEKAAIPGGLAGVQKSLLDRHSILIGTWKSETVRAMEKKLAGYALSGAPLLEGVKAIAAAGGVMDEEFWKAERIVRTETAYAHGAVKQGAMESTKARLFPTLRKKLIETFDDRTGDDSFIVHGQIVPAGQPFEWKAKKGESWVLHSFQHPPNRPNDRAVVIPWDPSWGMGEEGERPLTIAELKSARPTRYRKTVGVEVPPGHRPGLPYSYTPPPLETEEEADAAVHEPLAAEAQAKKAKSKAQVDAKAKKKAEAEALAAQEAAKAKAKADAEEAAAAAELAKKKAAEEAAAKAAAEAEAKKAAEETEKKAKAEAKAKEEAAAKALAEQKALEAQLAAAAAKKKKQDAIDKVEGDAVAMAWTNALKQAEFEADSLLAYKVGKSISSFDKAFASAEVLAAGIEKFATLEKWNAEPTKKTAAAHQASLIVFSKAQKISEALGSPPGSLPNGAMKAAKALVDAKAAVLAAKAAAEAANAKKNLFESSPLPSDAAASTAESELKAWQALVDSAAIAVKEKTAALKSVLSQDPLLAPSPVVAPVPLPTLTPTPTPKSAPAKLPIGTSVFDAPVGKAVKPPKKPILDRFPILPRSEKAQPSGVDPLVAREEAAAAVQKLAARAPHKSNKITINEGLHSRHHRELTKEEREVLDAVTLYTHGNVASVRDPGNYVSGAYPQILGAPVDGIQTRANTSFEDYSRAHDVARRLASAPYVPVKPERAGKPIYRSMYLPPSLIDEIVSAGGMDLSAVSSWTYSKKFADDWTLGKEPGKVKVVFSLAKPKRGTSIENLSYFPNEQEIFVGGKIRVTSAKRDAKGTIRIVAVQDDADDSIASAPET